MTNLERVTTLLKDKQIVTKTERKQAIELIVSTLNVSRSNAAVYLSKVQKLLDPKPVKTKPVTKEEVQQELQATNEKIASIIEKANNFVVTL